MNRASFTIGFLFLTIGVACPADWPHSMARSFARDGVRCDMKLWVGSVDQSPEWEGRILAKDEKIRVINRRASGNLDPGPEEMLWTGEGAVEFMGGRPTAFAPGSSLTLIEGYLLVDLLVPLWSPEIAGAGSGRIGLEGPLGTGYLAMSGEGRPESLVIEKLSRPLWDGAERVIVSFEGSDKSVPWDKATFVGEDGATILTFVRSKVRRKSLSDDLFEVEGGGLSLADLSRPIGQLLGSDDGEYTETAGAQGLTDEGGGEASAGGSVYTGVKPSQAEVDQFMKDGKLGRYSDE